MTYDTANILMIVASAIMVTCSFIIFRSFVINSNSRYKHDHFMFHEASGLTLGLLSSLSGGALIYGLLMKSIFWGVIFVFNMPFIFFMGLYTIICMEMEKALKEEVHKMEKKERSLLESTSNVENEVKLTLESRDYYQKLDTHPLLVLIVFITQVLLTGYYAWAVIEIVVEKEEFPLTLNRFINYMIGYLLLYTNMMLRMEKEVFNDVFGFWRNFYIIVNKRLKYTIEGRDREPQELSIKTFWVLYTMDMFVNLYLYVQILYLIPLHLAVSEKRVEIVLNIVAAYFIIELDDLKESSKIKFKIIEEGEESNENLDDKQAMENDVVSKCEEVVESSENSDGKQEMTV